MASDRWRSEDKYWERTEGFRETLLLYFRPKNSKALRRLGEMLFAHALETGEGRLKKKESWTRQALLAASRDLIHLTRFLHYLADTVEEEVGLAPEEAARLAAIVTRAAEEVAQIAGELGDALQGKAGSGHAPRS